MPRIFYDSVTASDIPVAINGVPIDGVLGYVDGQYKWSDADWTRFDPSTVRVRICVDPTTVADVLDVESGNPSTDQDAVSWYRMCVSVGVVNPTIYCSESRVADIVAAFSPTDGVDFDVASWPNPGVTGVPHTVTVPSGYNAALVQFATPETGSGGHYDLNVVWDDSWHPALVLAPSVVEVLASPLAVGATNPTTRIDLTIVGTDGHPYRITAPTPAELSSASWGELGGPTAVVSAILLQGWLADGSDYVVCAKGADGHVYVWTDSSGVWTLVPVGEVGAFGA